MIKIAETGNTIIRIAKGAGAGNKTQWTVHPEYTSGVVWNVFSEEQIKKMHELSITGFEERDDLNGQKMNKDIAEAIARLRKNLGLEKYEDLGLVADRIDVEPNGSIAQLLDSKFGIRPLEGESSATAEAKK